jgi:acetyl-CoA carboxylase carboxyltransferase component
MADGKETLKTIVKSVVKNDVKRAKVILDSLHGQEIDQLSDLGNLNAKRLEETLDDAKIKPPKTRADLEDKLKEYIKKRQNRRERLSG